MTKTDHFFTRYFQNIIHQKQACQSVVFLPSLHFLLVSRQDGRSRTLYAEYVAKVKRGDAYLCSKIAVSDRIQTPAKTQSSKTPKGESFYRTHIVQMWIMFMNSICPRHKIVQRLHLKRQRQSQAQTLLSSNQLSAELLSGSSLYGRCSNSSIKLRMLHVTPCTFRFEKNACHFCHNNRTSKQKIMNRNMFFM